MTGQAESLQFPTLLVTGANGFVLGNCIPVWLQLGYRIFAVDRQFSADRRESWGAIGDQIRFIEHDLITDGVRGLPVVDAVLHGAAVTLDPFAHGLSPEQHLQDNLLPALFLLSWMRQGGARTVICFSSSAVYASTYGIVDESQPVTPTNTYAIAKAAIEAHVSLLHAQTGEDVLTVRLGNVYGFGETPSPSRPGISIIGQMIHDAVTKNAIRMPPEGMADPQMREWTFAPDIARGIHGLLQCENPSHALYHVASGAIYDRGQVARAIKDVLPGIHFEAERLQHMRPTLNRRGSLSSERLFRDTGFSDWTPLSTGIRRAVEYALAHAAPEEA
jgi:UDP-glucose 4-epimerase